MSLRSWSRIVFRPTFSAVRPVSGLGTRRARGSPFRGSRAEGGVRGPGGPEGGEDANRDSGTGAGRLVVPGSVSSPPAPGRGGRERAPRDRTFHGASRRMSGCPTASPTSGAGTARPAPDWMTTLPTSCLDSDCSSGSTPGSIGSKTGLKDVGGWDCVSTDRRLPSFSQSQPRRPLERALDDPPLRPARAGPPGASVARRCRLCAGAGTSGAARDGRLRAVPRTGWLRTASGARGRAGVGPGSPPPAPPRLRAPPEPSNGRSICGLGRRRRTWVGRRRTAGEGPVASAAKAPRPAPPRRRKNFPGGGWVPRPVQEASVAAPRAAGVLGARTPRHGPDGARPAPGPARRQ